VRKLAVEFYNIWVMPSNKITYQLHEAIGTKKSGWLEVAQRLTNAMMHSDIDYLKRHEKYPFYMIKFIKAYRDIF
jgi:hypothetical protein